MRAEVARSSKIEHKLNKRIVNPNVGGGRGKEIPPPKILLVYTSLTKYSNESILLIFGEGTMNVHKVDFE